MNEKKVRVAVFDADLRCKIKKYPVSSNGKQININAGGTEHFMPRFDRNCRLEFPRFKKWLIIGDRQYEPIYIVMNKAKKCVDFSLKEPYVDYPSPEELDKALKALIATRIGTEGITIPMYIPSMLVVILVLLFWIVRLVGGF